MDYPFKNDIHNRYWYSIYAESIAEKGSGEYMSYIVAIEKTKEKFKDAEVI